MKDDYEKFLRLPRKTVISFRSEHYYYYYYGPLVSGRRSGVVAAQICVGGEGPAGAQKITR